MRIEHRLPDWQPGFLAYWVTHVIDAMARGYLPWAALHPLPPLYESGVRYRLDPAYGSGREVFTHPWRTLRRGWGDCNDLVLYRLIELMLAGDEARPERTRSIWAGNDVHVLVRRADGSIEDPSLILLHLRG